MTDLLELAARVEGLTGPDREVDAEIALATGIVRERDGNCFYGHRDYSVLVLERDYYDHEGGPPELPHFTRSLDAAMTLVPEEWFTKLAMQDRHSLRWKWELRGGFGHNCSAWSATPALALMAAALRARVHGGGEG